MLIARKLADAFKSVNVEGYTSCYQTVSERHMWRMPERSINVTIPIRRCLN